LVRGACAGLRELGVKGNGGSAAAGVGRFGWWSGGAPFVYPAAANGRLARRQSQDSGGDFRGVWWRLVRRRAGAAWCFLLVLEGRLAVAVLVIWRRVRFLHGSSEPPSNDGAYDCSSFCFYVSVARASE